MGGIVLLHLRPATNYRGHYQEGLTRYLTLDDPHTHTNTCTNAYATLSEYQSIFDLRL